MDGEVDPELLDLLAGTGGKVAGRIRDEELEQVGLGNVPVARSAEAADDRAGRPKNGGLGGLFRKALRIADVALGMGDRGLVEYGGTHDLEQAPTAKFHASHIELPCPGWRSTESFSIPAPGFGTPL